MITFFCMICGLTCMMHADVRWNVSMAKAHLRDAGWCDLLHEYGVSPMHYGSEHPYSVTSKFPLSDNFRSERSEQTCKIMSALGAR